MKHQEFIQITWTETLNGATIYEMYKSFCLSKPPLFPIEQIFVEEIRNAVKNTECNALIKLFDKLKRDYYVLFIRYTNHLDRLIIEQTNTTINMWGIGIRINPQEYFYIFGMMLYSAYALLNMFYVLYDSFLSEEKRREIKDTYRYFEIPPMMGSTFPSYMFQQQP